MAHPLKKSTPALILACENTLICTILNTMTKRNSPFLLCVLDGVGLSSRTEGNAVALAHTPVLDELFQTCPHSTLLTHGEHVGLPKGQMGNSEVGHMAIGAGRVLLQPLAQITQDLNTGDFARKPEWNAFLSDAKSANTVHVVGLCSYGGVHSHMDHIKGMLTELNKTGGKIVLHAITDGRDNAPRSAIKELPELETFINTLENVTLATICGRYTAMDRDKRWERTGAYYNLITQGDGTQANSISEAIELGYANNDSGDEFIQETRIGEHLVQEGDAILFANFRADRMRQIVRMFIDQKQNPKTPKLAAIATLTPYDESFEELGPTNFHILYPPRTVPNTLGEEISKADLTQLRIAETEKYPHVSYFFSGGREELFKGESRKLVNSPKVATYDLQPEMSLPEVTDVLLSEIENNTPDFIMLNMANGDMVGHTGDLDAAIRAVETVDSCVGKLAEAVMASGGRMMVTADHGNCETMWDSAAQSPHTAHTTNLVPVILVGAEAGTRLSDGRLADLAPSLLALMGLATPPAMTGRVLQSAGDG